MRSAGDVVKPTLAAIHRRDATKGGPSKGHMHAARIGTRLAASFPSQCKFLLDASLLFCIGGDRGAGHALHKLFKEGACRNAECGLLSLTIRQGTFEVHLAVGFTGQSNQSAGRKHGECFAIHQQCAIGGCFNPNKTARYKLSLPPCAGLREPSNQQTVSCE